MNKSVYKSFYPRFLPSLVFYGAIGAVILVIVERGKLEPVPSAIALITVVFIIYIFTRFHAVRVNREGISALDVWDQRHSVPWEDISSCKSITLGNLQFVRLYYHGGKRSLWVPLFLSRKKEFVTWIQENVKKGHPLNRFMAGLASNKSTP